MNKRILMSLLTIVAVVGVAFGVTRAYFSDTETSSGNVLGAGIVDIVVDGENPWIATYSGTLKDMKPSQTRYIEFVIENLKESNEVKVWKHIDIKSQEDGVQTEPECTEGSGTWDQAEETCGGSYAPRNNLAAYTIYDLWVCEDPSETRCITNPVTHKPSFGPNWKPIIKEDQHVRLDNVSSAWIYLGQLKPAKALKVVQSYHLRSWPDAPEPEVTNWAQGDVMTFNIDLYAEQLGGTGPKGAQTMVFLENKDPVTWVPITGDAIGGTLSYNTAGPTFNYTFTGKVLQTSTSYCLIYYADPWPGDGETHTTGKEIECKASDGGGNLTLGGNINLNTDLPNSDDQNYPGGAKLWVVLDSDYDNTNHKMTGWNPSQYLLEMNLITYDDTDA